MPKTKKKRINWFTSMKIPGKKESLSEQISPRYYSFTSLKVKTYNDQRRSRAQVFICSGGKKNDSTIQ